MVLKACKASRVRKDRRALRAPPPSSPVLLARLARLGPTVLKACKVSRGRKARMALRAPTPPSPVLLA